jgi:hypothetical protein
MGEEAFHPPRRTRLAGREKDKQGQTLFRHMGITVERAPRVR